MSANTYILNEYAKAVAFNFATWEIFNERWTKDVNNKELAKETHDARNNLQHSIKQQRQFIQKQLDKATEKVGQIRHKDVNNE